MKTLKISKNVYQTSFHVLERHGVQQNICFSSTGCDRSMFQEIWLFIANYC